MNIIEMNDENIFQQFNEIKENIDSLKSQLTSYEGKIKILEKNVKKKN